MTDLQTVKTETEREHVLALAADVAEVAAHLVTALERDRLDLVEEACHALAWAVRRIDGYAKATRRVDALSASGDIEERR